MPVDCPSPPVERGHWDAGLLGLVDLEGVVDIAEGEAILILSAK